MARYKLSCRRRVNRERQEHPELPNQLNLDIAESKQENDQTVLAGQTAEQTGTLYLCATPIGNLEDITLRVLRVLKEVDLVAAEDTRRTRGLLNHYGINKPLTSYYLHNQKQKGLYLVNRLREGKNVALISDAGTPGISDPGEELVQQALAAGIPVVALPGPSVVLTALSISGLATRRFCFEGFLPRSRRQRRQRIQELAEDPRTIILFEAPHRLIETLTWLLEIWGLRKAAVAREISKLFEEVIRGTLAEILSHFKSNPPRGEMTLVIEGYVDQTAMSADPAKPLPERIPPVSAPPTEMMATLMQEIGIRAEAGENPKAVIREIARNRKLNRRDLYQTWQSYQQLD